MRDLLRVSAPKGNALRGNLQVARIFAEVENVLTLLWGPERTAFVKPLSFKEGTLKMKSSAPVAMQQLRVDRVKILNELNRRLGARAVRDIRIELGPLEPRT